MAPRDAVIEVRGLVNRFGTAVIHDGLDLDLFRGEVLGVVGGSGTGKSVLLRSIVGLQRPAAGSIRVLGTEVLHASEAELRLVGRRWGVMFQDGALFSTMPVRENVMAPMVEHTRIPKPLMRELADLKIQSGEAVVLKKRVEVLEAAHRGMQEQIDRGNQANARLLQERKGLELRLEKYEEEFGLHAPIRTTNWLSETTVGSKRTQQRFALAAALAQLEAAELTCNAIVNGSIFSPAGDT